MSTLAQVARIALALPEVTEGERRETRTWSVADKTFAWERPFSKADLRRFGDDTPPAGPILAIRTADLADKAALLAADSAAVFTIPHFDGFSAILVALPKISVKPLRELLTDGWLACAPPVLTTAFLRR